LLSIACAAIQSQQCTIGEAEHKKSSCNVEGRPLVDGSVIQRA